MHENLYITWVYSSCKKACDVEPYKLSDTYRSHWTITMRKSVRVPNILISALHSLGTMHLSHFITFFLPCSLTSIPVPIH